MLMQRIRRFRELRLRHALFFMLLPALFQACDSGRELEPPTARGEVYFPLEIGMTWEYSVDSIVFDDFRKQIDTHYYQIQLKILDSIDENGRWAHLTRRSIREGQTEQWRFLENGYLYRDNEHAMEKRQNRMEVKLGFPLALYKSWDGNLFNSEDEQLFEILWLHDPYSVKGIEYESTLQVLQRDESNILEKSYAEEVYQKNIGLIQKRIIEKRSDQIGQEIPKGFDCLYTLDKFYQE